MKKSLWLFLVFLIPHSGFAAEEAASVPVDPAEAQAQTEPFTCDMNFFKAQVPAGWEANEEITVGRLEKVYGVDLKGPKNKDGAYTSMTLLYYGPDHPRFHSAEDFIKVNRDEEFSLKGETNGPLSSVTVAGRTGQEFTRHVFLLIPPYAPEPEKIPMIERLIILPGEKGGFYTLEYSSPEDSFENYRKVFEQVLTSFRPNA